jgi:hypothetical protein
MSTRRKRLCCLSREKCLLWLTLLLQCAKIVAVCYSVFVFCFISSKQPCRAVIASYLIQSLSRV